MPKPDKLLYLNDARGIYIPRDFTTNVGREYVSGITDDDWAILEAGPDHEYYWDAWDAVLTDAMVTSKDGVRYTLHQDGDLWLIPVGMEWDEEKDEYVWPEEEQYDERI